MSSRTDQLNTILSSLQSGSPEIEASALVSEDGLMIASALPQHIDEVRVAGICATLISLGMRAVSELDMGAMEQVMIKGDKGYAVMVKAVEGTDLIVLTTASAKLGMIFLDMNRTVSEIKKVL